MARWVKENGPNFHMRMAWWNVLVVTEVGFQPFSTKFLARFWLKIIVEICPGLTDRKYRPDLVGFRVGPHTGPYNSRMRGSVFFGNARHALLQQLVVRSIVVGTSKGRSLPGATSLGFKPQNKTRGARHSCNLHHQLLCSYHNEAVSYTSWGLLSLGGLSCS